MENKVYTLRMLKADDMFSMIKIINKIGLKEVKDCFNNAEIRKAVSSTADGLNEADVTTIGIQVAMELAGLIVSHLPDCKSEIYNFLASLSDMNVEEIADLPMGTFLEMVVDVFKKDEFKDFFQRVVGLLK